MADSIDAGNRSNHKTNICLNMIVKNETKVLPRLLKSVYACIDYYVIVDTGSTDGTPELIKAEMEKYGVDGEVHHHDWVNFGHNRQHALEQAVAAKKSHWLLFIDADEELGVSDPNFYQDLKPGISYNLEKYHGNMRYAVPHLVDISQNKWEWQGVVHNYLDPLTECQTETIKNPWIIYHTGEGAKSQGVTPEEKFLRDAKMLETELVKKPEDARNQFYLGQSYRDASYSNKEHQQKAYENYIKRSKMLNGWMDENYIALLEAGILAYSLNRADQEVTALLLSAHELRPNRAEALYHLAKIFRLDKQYHQAYLFAKASTLIAAPDEGLFINAMVYQWQRWDELSVAASQTGRHEESLMASKIILEQVEEGLLLDDSNLARLKSNLDFTETVINAMITTH